jgi:hypothetical protein
MKGDPSRRLEQVCQSQLNHGLRGHVLVEQHFTMLETSLDFLANSSDAERICFRALKEATVAAKDIRHSILSGSVEF